VNKPIFSQIPVEEGDCSPVDPALAEKLSQDWRDTAAVLREVERRAAGRLGAELVALVNYHDAQVLADELEPQALEAAADVAELRKRLEDAEAKRRAAVEVQARARSDVVAKVARPSALRSAQRTSTSTVRMHEPPDDELLARKAALKAAGEDVNELDLLMGGLRQDLGKVNTRAEGLTRQVRQLRAVPAPDLDALAVVARALEALTGAMRSA
jgi:hypothetical protein